MRLKSQLEYEVTCQKLAELQQLYKESQERPSADAHIKELTLHSLARLIKQLREEKIWYECHACVREPNDAAAASPANTEGTSTSCTN
jgi:hypothetical protein